jgi:hypothetical protein
LAEQIRVLKKEVSTQMLNQMARFQIISEFKAQIRSALMNKEHQLTTLDMIKTEALLIEFKEEKKESFYKW